MKAIMFMFDSLNRHLLPPYGGDWVKAPNISRLARHAVTFDQSYVCSMPCMPARRDFHTGRPNFMHRPWGPLEPFDDSVPQILREADVSTHLVTDHGHYFEDGGATYHLRYNTWQHFRGQEGDFWKGQVADPVPPPNLNFIKPVVRQDWINRQFIQEKKDWPQSQTVAAGLDFIDRNHQADNWFLQIETFDPHEPFYAHPDFQKNYARAGEEPLFDWPAYDDVHETPEEVERVRHNYASLVTQCDESLGRVLDAMDRYDLWKDTMLIVWTDHGFLLGEHGRWAKNIPTMWNEIAHTPFFVWDPRCGEAGVRRSTLVQPAIDLGPTLLRFFGQELRPDMTGHDLAAAIAQDSPVREAAIFGYFGQPIHVTDGRYVYMRHVENAAEVIHAYTWMPTSMRHRWSPEEMAGVELVDPLPFSKGMKVARFPRSMPATPGGHLLFDLQTDAAQQNPIKNPTEESRLVAHLERLLAEAKTPAEYLTRYGLN